MAEVKARFPSTVVSVDGGVSRETAPLLWAAGADRLVAGSALFEHGIMSENIEALAQAGAQ